MLIRVSANGIKDLTNSLASYIRIVGRGKLPTTLAVPGGAFVQAAKGIYSGVMLFVEKGKQIAQVGAAFLDSVGKIAAGQFAPAALAVENTLVNILPVALSFLAKWLNLDGISGAIQTGLKKVQAPVEKAVTKVLDVVTTKAQSLWSKLKAGAGKVIDKGKQVATVVGDKVAGWLGLRKEFRTVNGEDHELYFKEIDGEPQLVRASRFPQEVARYLHTLPPSLDITAALAQVDVIKRLGRITRTATSGPNTDTTIENKLIVEIEKLSIMLQTLVAPAPGVPVALPNAGWHYGPAAHPQASSPRQFARVNYLSRETAKGGEGADNSFTPEMSLVTGSGWVRMHLIAAAVGGKGFPRNWVPSPIAVNSSAAVLHSFERSAEELVRMAAVNTPKVAQRKAILPPAPDKQTVLWMNVEVTKYHDPAVAHGLAGFPETILFEHGLQLPPTPANPQWTRINSPLARQVVSGIAKPTYTQVKLSSATEHQLKGTQNEHLIDAVYGAELRRRAVRGDCRDDS